MTDIHKNRFGYYPCSWETYRKLKRLNYLRLQALRSRARWRRWDNKQPQNRYGVEPYYMDFEGLSKALEEYTKARYPQLDEASVRKLNWSEQQIDAYLEEAELEYREFKRYLVSCHV